MSKAVAKQGDIAKDLTVWLEQGRTQFEAVLPAHMNYRRLVRIAINAAIKTPKLFDCDRASLALALLNCAALGLEADGFHAHLVPYGNAVQLLVDYKGWIELGLRAGIQIEAREVCENDEFDYQFGSEAFLRHKPALADRGELRAVWAGYRRGDERMVFVVLDKDDVERHKRASKSAGNSDSPWQKHTVTMWRKSAVHELRKWMPKSNELQHAAALDDQATAGIAQTALLKQDAAPQFLSAPVATEGETLDEPREPQESKSQRMAREAKQSRQSKSAEQPGQMSDRLRGYDVQVTEAADVETLRQIVRDSAGDDQLSDAEKQSVAEWCQQKAERIKAGNKGELFDNAPASATEQGA